MSFSFCFDTLIHGTFQTALEKSSGGVGYIHVLDKGVGSLGSIPSIDKLVHLLGASSLALNSNILSQSVAACALNMATSISLTAISFIKVSVSLQGL